MRVFLLCRDQGQPEGELITDPSWLPLSPPTARPPSRPPHWTRKRKRLEPKIRGLRGMTPDWRISLGEPGEDKTVIDEDAIRADYEARGEVIPMTTKPGNAPRMTVTRIKKAKVRHEQPARRRRHPQPR